MNKIFRSIVEFAIQSTPKKDQPHHSITHQDQYLKVNLFLLGVVFLAIAYRVISN